MWSRLGLVGSWGCSLPSPESLLHSSEQGLDLPWLFFLALGGIPSLVPWVPRSTQGWMEPQGALAAVTGQIGCGPIREDRDLSSSETAWPPPSLAALPNPLPKSR